MVIETGLVTLVEGVATVLTSLVLEISNIQLTGQDRNVSGTPGVSSRVEGKSFNISSTSGGDSGVVGWVLINP